MKRTKYYLALFLSILPFLLAVGFVAIAAFSKNAEFRIFGFHIKNYYLYIAAVAMFVIGIVLRRPMQMIRGKTRNEVEYDEFGRSRRKGNFANLSRQERDMIDLQRTAAIEQLISSTELKRLTHKGAADPQSEMDALIGLELVKSRMEEMVARMSFEQIRTQKHKGRKKEENSSAVQSGHHMAFFGNPGTGKTTVARILAGFLYKYHYIAKNMSIEVDGNFLNAGGDSALKTRLLIQYANGGVLFIDEAYALMEGSHGLEVIATLIKEMEDKRDKFVLILAGYTNEMEYLLNTNPGFLSRIKEFLFFPDFTNDELWEIFRSMAKEQKFTVSDQAHDNFIARMMNEKKETYFGNGRTVRNILDEAIDKHALRYAKGCLPEEEMFVLSQEDIQTTQSAIFAVSNVPYGDQPQRN